MARQYHVVFEDDEWAVRLGPRGEVVFTHEYMRPAEREAKRLARVFDRGVVVLSNHHARDADVVRLDVHLQGKTEQHAGFQSWSACSARRPFSSRE